MKLYYVWTSGHGGATGMGPSGPICHGPVLAESKKDAIRRILPKLTSWDGAPMKATTDPDYRPRVRYDWS